MEEKEVKDEKIFKTPNDLKINVTKSNGEVVIDEECCTMVSIILKNTGDIAASFFGAHNPEVVKILEKSLKGYFKGIKKELKNNYKTQEEEIKVLNEEIPSQDKWSGEKVPDVEEESKPTKTPATKIAPVTKKTKKISSDDKAKKSEKQLKKSSKDEIK